MILFLIIKSSNGFIDKNLNLVGGRLWLYINNSFPRKKVNIQLNGDIECIALEINNETVHCWFM